MGPWTDALVEVEAAKGRALFAMMKGVVTGVIVALVAAFAFLPVVLAVLAHVLGNHWLEVAFQDVDWLATILLQAYYFIALFILYWLGRVGVALISVVWEWLS